MVDQFYSYFRTRDVTQNEILLFRESKNSVTIYYTPEAKEDCLEGNVRCGIRALVSDYATVWECNEEGVPIYGPKQFARAIIRMIKVIRIFKEKKCFWWGIFFDKFFIKFFLAPHVTFFT